MYHFRTISRQIFIRSIIQKSSIRVIRNDSGELFFSFAIFVPNTFRENRPKLHRSKRREKYNRITTIAFCNERVNAKLRRIDFLLRAIRFLNI